MDAHEYRDFPTASSTAIQSHARTMQVVCWYGESTAVRERASDKQRLDTRINTNGRASIYCMQCVLTGGGRMIQCMPRSIWPSTELRKRPESSSNISAEIDGWCVQDGWSIGRVKGRTVKHAGGGLLTRGEHVVVLLLLEHTSTHRGPHVPYELIPVFAQLFCRLCRQNAR